MHHHKTYMYINFQQNRANRSVITAHTNVFAKKRKLHKRRTDGRHDGRTDGTTDGRTDRRRVRQQSLVFFEKKYQKQMHARRTSIFLLCKNVL